MRDTNSTRVALSARSASVSVREGDVTVYMHVTRSQGLLGRVSVEWETQPGTAQGQSKIR